MDKNEADESDGTVSMTLRKPITAVRIGYACGNLTLRKSASRTFRLASYSEGRAAETIEANLETLMQYLLWNVEHNVNYFRISSGTIPLASHPIMTFDWRSAFADRLREIGNLMGMHGMRTNMHPGQYTLINTPREDVLAASVTELVYHADLLDLMGLDATNKIQLHVGGVYGDKDAAISRFVEQWRGLPEHVQARLVIENDERNYSLHDALTIHSQTGIPVLFDSFHHQILNLGEPLAEAINVAAGTWVGHGDPMLDYSSQDSSKQAGAHSASIDLDDFAHFVTAVGRRKVDVMLEIKDKEQSALRAISYLGSEPAN